ncbi:response regulator [Janibacter melonis]|uniref:Response regulator n=1 Tax=Janibacter melonis TaxID=262209 RepID=A0A5P8FMU0_9MICO|nr:response regulator [Janibacter melonis]MCB5990811.1 response regulator [Janibacter melonis]MCM3555042.1 response regulator [Janibacter melonis]QFQ30648.1 response regulator [Janibacter melonis]
MAEQTVVVADDDDDIRDLVAFKLENAGYEVISVADGDSAWDRVREVRPTLAVLDVMMPGMSGLDVLREIRADDSLAETKVILLTARSRDVDVDAGFSSGADDYLTKPFSPRELVHRVSSLLARG